MIGLVHVGIAFDLLAQALLACGPRGELGLGTHENYCETIQSSIIGNINIDYRKFLICECMFSHEYLN